MDSAQIECRKALILPYPVIVVSQYDIRKHLKKSVKKGLTNQIDRYIAEICVSKTQSYVAGIYTLPQH